MQLDPPVRLPGSPPLCCGGIQRILKRSTLSKREKPFLVIRLPVMAPRTDRTRWRPRQRGAPWLFGLMRDIRVGCPPRLRRLSALWLSRYRVLESAWFSASLEPTDAKDTLRVPGTRRERRSPGGRASGNC